MAFDVALGLDLAGAGAIASPSALGTHQIGWLQSGADTIVYAQVNADVAGELMAIALSGVAAAHLTVANFRVAV